MKFTVDWVSISINYGLIAFPYSWVLFPLLINYCLLVPLRICLWIPVMSTSIFPGLLTFPRLLERTAQNPPHWFMCLPLLSWSGYGCLLLPGRNFRLILSWVQYNPRPCARNSHNSRSFPINPMGLPLFFMVTPSLDSYWCAGGLSPPLQWARTFSATGSVLGQRYCLFT